MAGDSIAHWNKPMALILAHGLKAIGFPTLGAAIIRGFAKDRGFSLEPLLQGS